MKQDDTSNRDIFPKIPGCLEEDLETNDGLFAGVAMVGVGCAIAGSLITWAVISWWPV